MGGQKLIWRHRCESTRPVLQHPQIVVNETWLNSAEFGALRCPGGYHLLDCLFIYGIKSKSVAPAFIKPRATKWSARAVLVKVTFDVYCADQCYKDSSMQSWYLSYVVKWLSFIEASSFVSVGETLKPSLLKNYVTFILNLQTSPSFTLSTVFSCVLTMIV